jgi:hypothetical protein
MATHKTESSPKKKISNYHMFRQGHKKHYKKKERALKRHKDLKKYFNKLIIIKCPVLLNDMEKNHKFPKLTFNVKIIFI